MISNLSLKHTADADATQLSASAVCIEFATSSRRLPTDLVENLETEHVENLLPNTHRRRDATQLSS